MTELNLQAKQDAVENDLRSVGVYLDNARWISPGEEEHPDGDVDSPQDSDRRGASRGSHVLMVDAYLGDVAFTSRVQDPQQHDFDAEFRSMTRSLDAASFKETQAELRERLLKGGNVFDEGPNEDS